MSWKDGRARDVYLIDPAEAGVPPDVRPTALTIDGVTPAVPVDVDVDAAEAPATLNAVTPVAIVLYHRDGRTVTIYAATG
jgi:hypothetical protein